MKKNREKKIIKTSIISIIANIVLAAFKAFIGLISNSIAIISDAVNNLSDALSSIITIIGTKLAGKPADKKHPFGYGRIEYMTSLIVSAIVLYAGITALIESIKKVINPVETNYPSLTLIILVGAILTKFILGIYVQNKGKELNSDALTASGLDAFNDGLLSISVLGSALIYMITNISLEAYVGILVSIFIIKAGLELIKESVDNMLGNRVETTLAKAIKKEIKKEKEVEGAYDLVLHDYGPDKYLGSVHIEINDNLLVSDIDKISRNITKSVYEKYGVLLHTIGVYSINTKDKNIIKAKEEITKIVFSNKDILEMHGFYLDEKEKTISFDIIIDFEAKNHKEIYKKIYDEVQNKYKEYKINITLDVDTSD